MTSLLLETADPVRLSIGGIATLLPDIDISTSPFGQILPWASRWFEERFPHRSCTHSLIASGVVAIATYPFSTLGYLPWGVVHAINIGFFAGYIADTFSKAGIELFWPSHIRFVIPGNRNLRLATGSNVEYSLLVVLTALTLFIININFHGGIRIQVNRLLASPEGVQEIYNRQGASHLVIAHIKGVRSDDRTPVQGDFYIIEAKGKEFIVQSKSGEIYKAGVEQDAQLITEYITADTGPGAITKIESINLEEDQLGEKLSKFTTAAFVSGQIKVDDPEEVNISRDPSQLATIKKNSEHITLESAPVALVLKKIGDQFATGELTVKSIYYAQQKTSGPSS